GGREVQDPDVVQGGRGWGHRQSTYWPARLRCRLMATETATPDELEAFRQRARAWLAENMPKTKGSRRPGADPYEGRLSDDERVARARMLQRTMFEGGFAGIVFPTEYGGQGLTPAHQRVFAEETAGYEMPLWLN